MRYIIVLLCFSCLGFADNNTIKKAEKQYRYEYHGQKDRYNEAFLRQDPEVLVAPARPMVIKNEIQVVIQDIPKPEEPKTIIKSCVQIDDGECVKSDEFIATIE